MIFPGVPDANGFRLSPANLRHYGDPFDRFMICQAQAEGLTIVTCDTQFPAYGVPLLW